MQATALTTAQTTSPQHAITWFEIPVTDLVRAQTFYETLLGASLRREVLGPEELAVFPTSGGEAGIKGCLHLSSERTAPSSQGTRVYLDVSPSMDAALSRAVAAGGRINTPKVARLRRYRRGRHAPRPKAWPCTHSSVAPTKPRGRG